MRTSTLRILLSIAYLGLFSLAACGGSSASSDDSTTPEFREDEEPLASDEMAASPGEEQIEPESRVFFALDSAELTPLAQSELEDVAAWLVDNEERELVIEGHADPQGAADYNQELSEKRAIAVYQFLLDQGIPAERMERRAFGESEADEAPYSINRRALIYATEDAQSMD
ncbi:OmpA family protein [Haliangium ochraceum]|uniref:OmpA/MotB domain protein n=1 Tax=Haliangium ochraceum (strain DSM 14365 / JCM 11303 / SMP-2) TaxID=502025 RepID=D0LWG9_HALO1|nr:OmpA family protein [Haliangium ochraceum]ACY17619.1 OmpA/MotB domain protein [Haliangium ochraceum DSM 14365]